MVLLRHYPWMTVYLISILSAAMWMPLVMFGPRTARAFLRRLCRQFHILELTRLRLLCRMRLRLSRLKLARLSIRLLICALLLILLALPSLA